MPRTQARSRRGSGRRGPTRRGPKGEAAAVRQALLDAAAQVILEEGVPGLSFRRVAERAGVTPAMVPYYFESRRGLLSALLDAGFAPILERLEAAPVPESPEAAQALLAGLLGELAARPWLPALMLATVLAGDTLRDAFLARHAPRIRAAGLRAAGAWRSDVDPRHGLLSVLAMCVFPFLARPVVERVFGLSLDEAFAQGQAAHIVRLMAPAAPPLDGPL